MRIKLSVKNSSELTDVNIQNVAISFLKLTFV